MSSEPVDTKNLHPALVVLGIDPASAMGRLEAMALVQFGEGQRHVIDVCETRIGATGLLGCLSSWQKSLHRMVAYARRMNRPVDMIACEDPRSRGRGGASLQAVVRTIKDTAGALGICCELVNPSTVKLKVTGNGAASTAEVANMVRYEYTGLENVQQEPPDYDLEMAVAVAAAAYAKFQESLLNPKAGRRKKNV